MKLFHRRILYIFFILIFLALAPILLMYTAGYRISLKDNKVVRTGVFILETKPKQVNVYINDKLRYTKTPIHRESLKEGLYDFRVIKKGYYPWQKELEIKGNFTTFAQDVVLFKKTNPVKIIDGDFSDFTLSPDNKKIITLWQDDISAEIWEYDLEGNKSNLRLRNSLKNSKIQIMDWSSNSRYLLFNDYNEINNRNNYFIVRIKKNFLEEASITEVVYLNHLIASPLRIVRFDDYNDNILYASTDNSIYRVDLSNQSVNKIVQAQTSDFIIYDKILYFDTRLSCLIEINKNSASIMETKENDCTYRLNNDKDYKLFSSPRGLITLVSPSSENLLVLDLNNKNKLFQTKSKKVKWNTISNQMLYYDDFGTGTFSPSHEDLYKDEIIGRYSQEVKNILWYPSHHHIIILLKDRIKIIELDARDKRNIIDFVNFSDLKNIYLDEEGENIYILGKKGEAVGIWQINIF